MDGAQHAQDIRGCLGFGEQWEHATPEGIHCSSNGKQQGVEEAQCATHFLHGTNKQAHPCLLQAHTLPQRLGIRLCVAQACLRHPVVRALLGTPA